MERGVLPIGDWSITMALSRFLIPSILRNFPGNVLALLSLAESSFWIMAFTRDDFPLPDTPVTQVNVPRGIFTSISFRLFSAAPKTSRNLPLPFRLSSGTAIFFLPLRYCPVMDFSQFIISSTVPAATISPPWTPAPTPTSTIKSAARMVSSSCSTTITLFPISRSLFRVSISLPLSR